MNHLWDRLKVPAGIVVLLVALAGCTRILDTTPIATVEDGGLPTCINSAGAYHLPRKVLSMTVSGTPGAFVLNFNPTVTTPTTTITTTTTTSTTTTTTTQTNPSIFSVADPSVTFCLDYLASPTADDTIAIQRTPDGLLQAVSANANDRSLDIATALIDVARLSAVAAGSRSLAIKEGTDLLSVHFEMDPFDQAEAAAINQSLKDFGYCVYVKGFTFSPKIDPDEYCRRPRMALAYAPLYTKAPPPPVLFAASLHGVLYRPNELHEVVVMTKPDPQGPGRWRRLNSFSVEMPNVAPVFSIDVDRTYFALRKTVLRFDNGVLKDVELTKGSELNAISQIPLEAVQAVASVPTEVIQIRLSNVNNEQALIDAQSALIKTYRDYQSAQGLVPAATGVLPPTGANRQTQLLQNCYDSGATADFCRAAIVGPNP